MTKKEKKFACNYSKLLSSTWELQSMINNECMARGIDPPETHQTLIAECDDCSNEELKKLTRKK